MEYLKSIFLRYKKASRKQKRAILDEFCLNCGYHRKHAIRKLKTFKRFIKPRHKKKGKPSIYNNPAFITPLKRIWLAAHLPCSKRLKVILPLWLPYYVQEFNEQLSPELINLLMDISSSTIDRVLKPIRTQYRGKGRSLTKPGSLLRNQIPIKTDQWNEFRPGFIESDTVHHCGESTEGQYAITINYTDIASGWTEQRAVWGKGEQGVFKQTKNVEKSLPFAILGFDADNGGEFINEHMFRYFNGRKQNPVQFTRSRPYKKNDNAHIEQKNWTHVRQWLGYSRFDNPKVVALMNNLYSSEWRFYHNFFSPSVKLIEKKRLASRIIKRYDKPLTPYQRLLASPNISDSTKQKLKEQFKTLNPF
ncbi:MAG: integrase [Candidatus Omnitrophica bacterium]|nr:integrase [Candidatus Omnitrophota bacterium]MBU4478975.1 integrase [Candidatus Omnitrophota bacterium]